MGPTQFQYSLCIIQRKLGINTALAAIGLTYAAIWGLTYSLIDFLVLGLIGLSLHRAYQSLLILTKRRPAIVISDDGLRDAHLGNILIPWAAIREIKAIAPDDGMAIGLLLMVDAAQFRSIPGPLAGRIINFVTGARPGRPNRRMALLMTPAVALDVTLADLLEQIRSRCPAAGIPISRAE
jgi:hypothetical protein